MFAQKAMCAPSCTLDISVSSFPSLSLYKLFCDKKKKITNLLFSEKREIESVLFNLLFFFVERSSLCARKRAFERDFNSHALSLKKKKKKRKRKKRNDARNALARENLRREIRDNRYLLHAARCARDISERRGGGET